VEQNKHLLKLLAQAHTNELALVKTLEAHAKVVEDSRHKALIERHLSETQDHAARIARRLRDLGQLHSPVAVAYDIAQSVAKQAMVLAKGPVDAVRGGRDTQKKMLKIALDESMTESLEIASYVAIESFAKALGDTDTASLAADIRADEEKMLKDLRRIISELSKTMAKNSIIRLEAEEKAGAST
jgi:ferritin-like metal-binding protein YciE